MVQPEMLHYYYFIVYMKHHGKMTYQCVDSVSQIKLELKIFIFFRHSENFSIFILQVFFQHVKNNVIEQQRQFHEERTLETNLISSTEYFQTCMDLQI